MAIADDLTAATAAPLVLGILCEGESYGFAILGRVRALSGGRVDWPDGLLYPLLRRLGRLGYVTSDWRRTPEGRPRRYYVITEDGRSVLEPRQTLGETVLRALSGVWRGCGRLLAAGVRGDRGLTLVTR